MFRINCTCMRVVYYSTCLAGIHIHTFYLFLNTCKWSSILGSIFIEKQSRACAWKLLPKNQISPQQNCKKSHLILQIPIALWLRHGNSNSYLCCLWVMACLHCFFYYWLATQHEAFILFLQYLLLNSQLENLSGKKLKFFEENQGWLVLVFCLHSHSWTCVLCREGAIQICYNVRVLL